MSEKKVAMIISGFRYDAQSAVIKGIVDTLRDNGVKLFIFTCDTSWEKTEKDRRVFKLLKYEDYDGIILYGDTIESTRLVERLVEEILESGKPAITIKDPHEKMHCVTVDGASAIKEIVRHMVLVHNARKINFVAGVPDNVDSMVRLAAYKDALTELGLPIEEDRIGYGLFRPDKGGDVFRRWYAAREQLPIPDAIICASDWMAIGIYEAAKDAGIKIPDDIRVSGVDDTMISRVSEPTLTTTPFPGHELGNNVAQKMLSLLSGETICPLTSIKSIPRYRCSCGCREKNGHRTEAIDMIRREYYHDSLYHVNYMDILKQAEEELAGVGDWSEFYNVVEKYVHSFAADAFYLCETLPHHEERNNIDVYIENNKAETTYDGYVRVPIAIVNGEKKEIDKFSDDMLLPDHIIDGHPGDYYVVYPLHYQKHRFGYCIASNSSIAYENTFFGLFIQIISTAMENLWNRERLEHIIELLDELWIYDRLTGVMNRFGFDRYSVNIINAAMEENTNLYILFADVDGLKKVNDTYGHETGDEYICEAARIIRSIAKNNEILMRYGGDEFVLFGKGLKEDEIKELTNEIENRTRHINELKKYQFEVSISVGYIINTRPHDYNMEKALEEADRNMYEIKKLRKKERGDR